MTYTPIAPGTLNWDAPVNAAFAAQDSRITTNEASGVTQDGRLSTLEQGNWRPVDYGLAAWTYDPAGQTATLTMTTGLIYMAKMKFAAGTVSALGIPIQAVGTGLVAGQSFMALYSNSGNLLGQTADQSATWAGTPGYKQASLVTPVVVAADYYHVAMFSNGTTPPTILRGSNITASPTFVNLNLTAANARFATAGTATTAPPASITMSGRTPITMAVWLTAA